jgi:thiamine biosynthesis lipoprotein
MPKTFTDLTRHALNGATMGTRWQALFHAPASRDVASVKAAMAAAVDQIDRQMSTWQAESDVNRLSAAAPGVWVDLPAHLMAVLARGVQVGAQSGGAFDLGLGDAVTAWGFGPLPADEAAIRAARDRPRRPAYQVLELDVPNQRARKQAPLQIDLNGIAKGYGVDRLAEVALSFGVTDALLAIDGELRALGHQPDGRPWPVAVEAPELGIRSIHSVLELTDAAVATSGDYRHWVTVGQRHLSHTMDPSRGLPLPRPPSSVTVIAEDCCSADAWATAYMVLGETAGVDLANRLNHSVLFLTRDRAQGTGTGVFAAERAA